VEVLLSEARPAPVVFIHGLWMHATSWDDWSDLFANSGYQCIAPGCPGDSSTVDDTRANAISAPARPLFRAGFANFAPRSEATVDTRRERGPLLLIAGAPTGPSLLEFLARNGLSASAASPNPTNA
jgi:hypothetical protein